MTGSCIKGFPSEANGIPVKLELARHGEPFAILVKLDTGAKEAYPYHERHDTES